MCRHSPATDLCTQFHIRCAKYALTMFVLSVYIVVMVEIKKKKKYLSLFATAEVVPEEI